MSEDYSKKVSKMSDRELSKGIEKIGKIPFVGLTDEYRLFSVMILEKIWRDSAEREFLSREPISRFEIMEL